MCCFPVLFTGKLFVYYVYCLLHLFQLVVSGMGVGLITSAIATFLISSCDKNMHMPHENSTMLLQFGVEIKNLRHDRQGYLGSLLEIFTKEKASAFYL